MLRSLPEVILTSFAWLATATAMGQKNPLPEKLTAEERLNIGIFEQNSPSVVHITTVGLERRGLFSLNVMKVPRGTGTGFVWDHSGHIVTNFHVVQGGHEIRVTFKDHGAFEAQLVGIAPEKDLAVVKIKPGTKKLRPIPLGDSKILRVGQKTFAIGNPFGLDQTLTTGIISALDREIESISRTPIDGVIQTDAAINPGNSGGPLLNSSGELIGVNTAIYSPSGAYAGIGFAIPSDTIAWVIPELIAHGRIARPSIGITVLPDRIAYQLDLEGAIIYEVQPGSPAERAGLRGTRRDQRGQIQLGDQIVGLERHDISSGQDLMNKLPAYKVGDTVTLKIKRGGRLLSVQVKLTATK